MSATVWNYRRGKLILHSRRNHSVHSDKSFFALIPARSGSKRLPHKNKRLLCGKPLIAWTIEAALRSRYLDTVCVSTDDQQIIEIARSKHAEAPFLRPTALAIDQATSASVLMHAIDYYKANMGKSFDCVVLLQPTSPLRTADDIDRAIEYYFSTGASAVVSVCPQEHTPILSMTLPADYSLSEFIERYEGLSLEEKKQVYYRVNGALYICREDTFTSEQSFFPRCGTYAFVMPQDRSVDIDTELDFFIAESILKHKNVAPQSQS
jgi:CMP-N-acetylneuraminic acid synthetase